MEKLLVLKEQIGKIRNAEDVFSKIKTLKIDFSQENLIVFYLNTKNILIDAEVLFKGGINSSIVDLRILFKNALLKGSTGIIVAHNHPSEDLEASSEDIEVKNKIIEAGELLQIKLLDFVIFSKTHYINYMH
jgi:DNA repair protein RadC